MSLTPKQLVAACRKGEPEAWDEVLERYGRLIWSVARRLGAREDEAEEVFQRTWIAVVEGIHQLKKADRLASWIAGTARHQTLQLITEQARQRRAASLDEQAMANNEPIAHDDAEAALARVQEAATLYDALDRLELRCRELLEMLFFEDPAPDYREISRRTGLAMGSIGPIRARCLKRLKQQYGKVQGRQ